MCVALVPALASAGALTGPWVAVPALAAILLGTAAPVFVKLERERARGVFQRAIVMLFAVGQPMLLYGLAAADWAREQLDGLVGQAREILEPYGERARLLRQAADFVANRRN